jgi:hypothetical protein
VEYYSAPQALGRFGGNTVRVESISTHDAFSGFDSREVISPFGFLGFVKSKMVDEILEDGQVLDRQIFELNSVASPRVFRNFPIMCNSELKLVHVNETAVGGKYFYFGAPFLIPPHRQIPDAQPAHADILDLPRVDKLIGPYKNSECPFFAFEPFVFSFFHKHFIPAQSGKK